MVGVAAGAFTLLVAALGLVMLRPPAAERVLLPIGVELRADGTIAVVDDGAPHAAVLRALPPEASTTDQRTKDESPRCGVSMLELDRQDRLRTVAGAMGLRGVSRALTMPPGRDVFTQTDPVTGTQHLYVDARAPAGELMLFRSAAACSANRTTCVERVRVAAHPTTQRARVTVLTARDARPHLWSFVVGIFVAGAVVTLAVTRAARRVLPFDAAVPPAIHGIAAIGAGFAMWLIATEVVADAFYVDGTTDWDEAVPSITAALGGPIMLVWMWTATRVSLAHLHGGRFGAQWRWAITAAVLPGSMLTASVLDDAQGELPLVAGFLAVGAVAQVLTYRLLLAWWRGLHRLARGAAR
jgi:hypothetical protein